MGWSLVQSAKGTASADVNTLSATFGSAVTAGNTIIVGLLGTHFFSAFDLSFITPKWVTDNKGNSGSNFGAGLYDLDDVRSDNASSGNGLPGGRVTAIFSAWNVASGNTTITVDGVNAADGLQLYIAEFSGGPTTNSAFAFAAANNSTGTADSGVMDSSLQSGDLQIGLLYDEDIFNATITVNPALSPAYTELQSDESAANGSSSTRPGGEMDYRIQTGTSTEGISFSARGGFDWVCLSVAYAAAGGGGVFNPTTQAPPPVSHKPIVVVNNVVMGH